jgi:hypothetical protein
VTPKQAKFESMTLEQTEVHEHAEVQINGWNIGGRASNVGKQDDLEILCLEYEDGG